MVENDGFELGDKHLPIDKNDLPDALKKCKIWKEKDPNQISKSAG
jgi:hypothetical protein